MKSENHQAENFEKLFEKGLKRCLTQKEYSEYENGSLKLCAAVSGGADSIALVTALFHLVKNKDCLKAVTVNHNIRPDEETSGDAAYVQEYCRSLGIECFRQEIKRGTIETLAAERKSGIEEAARFARYREFEKILLEKKIDLICLAHNQNDQTETVLMRFLQGSSAGALSGIPCRRNRYIRPMLEISREQIEAYLNQKRISWRTDGTNSDTNLLRNRIRCNVIPSLNQNIAGWQKAVIALARKSAEDEEVLRSAVEKALELVQIKDGCNEEKTLYSLKQFVLQPKAVQRRIVFAASEKYAEERIPSSLIESICVFADENKNSITEGKNKNQKTEIFSACGVQVSISGDQLVFQKKAKEATESGFFAILKEPCELQAGPWYVKAECASGKKGILISAVNDTSAEEKKILLEGLEFPFAFRSRQSADSVECADHSFKSLKKVFESWHIKHSETEGAFFQQDVIPVIQELYSGQQKIICVWGSLLGFDDWIVRI